MGLFANFRKNRALKHYARKLPPKLARDYGAAEFFTPAQIRTAAGKLSLDPVWVGHAYAMFLPESEFRALHTSLPNSQNYEEARREIAAFLPSPGFSAGNSYDFLRGIGSSNMPALGSWTDSWGSGGF